MNKNIKIIIFAIVCLLSANFAMASEVSGVVDTGGVVMENPISSLKEGIYDVPQYVELFANNASSIHYTLNGETAKCTDPNVYGGKFKIEKSSTLNAVSCYGLGYELPSKFEYKIEIKSKGSGSSGSYSIMNGSILGKGEVLGEFTCKKYLINPIVFGRKNNVEDVRKLQAFLNKEMKAQIPLTGFFGIITKNYVVKFQEKYRDEILGGGSGTGNVYKMTLSKINKLECTKSVSKI